MLLEGVALASVITMRVEKPQDIDSQKTPDRIYNH